ncbi:MAG: site-specific integrase [Propionibacteriaceae bacterium]|jgi:integrase|nr:site-specific integrase [Propionibacteriaceae bacterium]
MKASAPRGKGEGAVFERKNGTWVGRVEVGVIDGKRVQRSVTGKTKKVVLAKMDQLKSDIRAGITPDTVTVAQWMDTWLSVHCQERGLKPKTVYGYTRHVENYVKPTIGKVQLKRLTPDHVRAVHQAMRKRGLSETTVRQTHVILSRALKVAEREGKIRRNPCSLMDAPSAAVNPHEILTLAQAHRLLSWAAESGDVGLLARLAVAVVLGLRQGEALGLLWKDVHLKEGWLAVDEALATVPGVGRFRQEPKSARSKRQVPLPRPVVQMLAAWRRESGGKGYVFPSPSGGPRDSKADWRVWTKALESAGIPHVPLHGARGTAATLLMAMEVPERVIADILGHSQVNITMKHYLHSDEAQRAAALDGLAGALELSPA